MIAAGDLNSLDEGRELVRNSCETAEFEPGDSSPWEAPFEVLKKNLDH
jgi:hypothetical protein